MADADAYLQYVAPASTDAARILSGLGDPIFSGKDGVALQILPEKPVSVAVLFPTSKRFTDHLKTLRSAGHSLCQVLPQGLSANAPRAILCDPDVLRKLDILIRLSHQHEYISLLKNDWAIMDLLDRIDKDPTAVLTEADPQVSGEHMEEHLTLILTFLLAHESWHLQHPGGTRFDTSGLTPDLANELSTKFVCRNYEEFSRRGIGLGILQKSPSIPLSQEGTTDDPTTRSYFAQTRAVWKDEVAADEYGGEIMARFIRYIKEKGAVPKSELEDTSSEIIQKFGNIMLASWFSTLQPFAVKHCSDFAGQDFYLTRCMCGDKGIYTQVLQLFGSTHPPIVLRMYTAATRFAQEVKQNPGIELTSDTNPNIAIARGWLILLDGLLDVPLKLSLADCWQLSKVVTPGGNIVQVLPDFAGFVGPAASSKYPGYPADESAFMAQCLLGPKNGAKSTPQQPGNSGNAEIELLSKRIDLNRMPSVSARNCSLRMAGVMDALAGLDDLDLDMLYMRAARDTPAEFAVAKTETTPPKKYATLMPLDGRNRLQTIIKSGTPCKPSAH
jgi:hypothetical protein